MIVKKHWFSRETRGFDYKYHYYGWFLFGIISLYVVREGNS